jgi:hypothetical protein
VPTPPDVFPPGSFAKTFTVLAVAAAMDAMAADAGLVSAPTSISDKRF